MDKRLYSLIISIVLFACTSSEGTISNDKYLREIIVGEGGGFTGEYMEFVLKENGNVYKKDFQFDRYVLFKKIDQAKTDAYFKKLESFNIEGIEFNQQGNMNYYIELKSNNVSINKVAWCARWKVPNEQLISFHRELIKELSKME